MIIVEIQTVTIQTRSLSNCFVDKAYSIVAFNPFYPSVAFHTETNHLIYIALG